MDVETLMLIGAAPGPSSSLVTGSGFWSLSDMIWRLSVAEVDEFKYQESPSETVMVAEVKNGSD